MIRAKMLAVFAGMIATLAISAVPASAEFTSTNGKATGAGKSGPVVLEGGGATLECASAEGKGTIENAEGKEATKGPSLLLNTEKWNECKAKTSSQSGLKPTVSACTLKLKQAAGESTAKGSVVSACTVKTTVLFINCTITVVAEKESEKVNFGLVKNALTNSGGNLIINAEDSGITTSVSSGCGFGGVKASNENKQKAEVKGEGVNFS
jgi:hypothetical protein